MADIVEVTVRSLFTGPAKISNNVRTELQIMSDVKLPTWLHCSIN